MTFKYQSDELKIHKLFNFFFDWFRYVFYTLYEEIKRTFKKTTNYHFHFSRHVKN